MTKTALVALVLVAASCGRVKEGTLIRKVHEPEQFSTRVEQRGGECTYYHTQRSGNSSFTYCMIHAPIYRVNATYRDDEDWVLTLQKCKDNKKCKTTKWWVTEPLWREASLNAHYSVKEKGASLWDDWQSWSEERI